MGPSVHAAIVSWLLFICTHNVLLRNLNKDGRVSLSKKIIYDDGNFILSIIAASMASIFFFGWMAQVNYETITIFLSLRTVHKS